MSACISKQVPIRVSIAVLKTLRPCQNHLLLKFMLLHDQTVRGKQINNIMAGCAERSSAVGICAELLLVCTVGSINLILIHYYVLSTGTTPDFFSGLLPG